MRAPLCAAVVCAAASVTVGVAVTAAAQSSADPTLDVLLARASYYVVDFIDQFTTVVAEEQYIQDSTVALPSFAIPGLRGRGATGSAVPTQRARHRELKSDFLMVKSAGSQFWQPFRDVFEVDHVPVRDREERLTKLFLDPSADNLSRAEEIVDESSRYNLGAVKRTINNPVFALMLLTPEYQWRFHFTLGKQDKRAGDDVWVVEYAEQERPSVIHGVEGHDMPAHGRFWIERESGRIVKVELLVKQPEIDAALTTLFRTEERFGITVPSEMREEYEMPSGHVSGRARYSKFRRFQVSADHEVTPQ
jgi:hypothetical protein